MTTSIKDRQRILQEIRKQTLKETEMRLKEKDIDKEIIERLREIERIDKAVKLLSKAKEIKKETAKLNKIKQKQINELEKLMKSYCPNLLNTAGQIISAKLIEKAGSLEKLAKMPSSRIQLLGAEAAFFRFLTKERKKLPKHGILLLHSSVQKAENKGKAARVLANKVAIAAKVDYFKK